MKNTININNMKKQFFYRKISVIFFVLGSIYVNTNVLLAQSTKTKMLPKIVFTCPPCGCDGDSKHSDKFGTCSDCGAPLYPILDGMKNEYKSTLVTKNVAILVFQGVELIDYTGPWEVLGAAGMNVYSVAKNDSLISCFPGLKIKPDYTFKDCPKPDILLIPGGNVNTDDTETVSWIKNITIQTEHTVSVCTGAYYLGTTGLLDNTNATTFYEAVSDFKSKYPKVKMVDDARFVDNGKIITAAGLSSGIDLAFHLVSIYQGEAEAKRLANLLEYNWDSQDNYSRGKLADIYLTGFLRLFAPFEHKVTEYRGDQNHWQMVVQIKTNMTLEPILKLIDYQATELNHWSQKEKDSYEFLVHLKKMKCTIKTEVISGEDYNIRFELHP